MDLGREVGRGDLGRLGAGKRDLHDVEVSDVPWHDQVHRAELADEALQFLNPYAALGGGY